MKDVVTFESLNRISVFEVRDYCEQNHVSVICEDGVITSVVKND